MISLEIGDQFSDILLVDFAYKGTFSQAPLAFLVLAREDVAGISPAPFDLSGAGLTEALGGAPVGLDLWHLVLRFVS